MLRRGFLKTVAATLFLPIRKSVRPDAYITGVVGKPPRIQILPVTEWRFIHKVNGVTWLDAPLLPRRKNWLRETWRRISALQSTRSCSIIKEDTGSVVSMLTCRPLTAKDGG